MSDLSDINVEKLFEKNRHRVNIIGGVRKRTRLADDKRFYNSEQLLRRGYTQAEIDSVEARKPQWLREAEDLSYLNGKIVGAEGIN
jgi:hypothetical protein